ncbi:hypothetical protein [Fulvimarina sp. MAC8]|uniref:hypothetical protein n=1 Tax=Fulvimarina sp. MAC8 TaxID=3162874 RepID=UPI0032EF3A91
MKSVFYDLCLEAFSDEDMMVSANFLVNPIGGTITFEGLHKPGRGDDAPAFFARVLRASNGSIVGVAVQTTPNEAAEPAAFVDTAEEFRSTLYAIGVEALIRRSQQGGAGAMASDPSDPSPSRRESDPPALAETGLPSLHWKLPQKDLPEVGIEYEQSLRRTALGYEGRGIFWFRYDTQNITGFCPQTPAMLKICENAQKAGVRDYRLSLTETVADNGFRMRGTAVPATGNMTVAFEMASGPAIGPLFKANGWYVRFRENGEFPKAWLEVRPLARAAFTPQEVRAQGTWRRAPEAVTEPEFGAVTLTRFGSGMTARLEISERRPEAGRAAALTVTPAGNGECGRDMPVNDEWQRVCENAEKSGSITLRAPLEWREGGDTALYLGYVETPGWKHLRMVLRNFEQSRAMLGLVDRGSALRTEILAEFSESDAITPPAASGGGGTYLPSSDGRTDDVCDAFFSALDEIRTSPASQEARRTLMLNGYWSGIVPREEDQCRRAARLLAEAGIEVFAGL